MNSLWILALLSAGFIMTVSRPCYFGNLLLGVVGVDVNLAYILEDVTYYQDSLASYTFLIDNKGQSHRDRRGGSNRAPDFPTYARFHGHHIRISRTTAVQETVSCPACGQPHEQCLQVRSQIRLELMSACSPNKAFSMCRNNRSTERDSKHSRTNQPLIACCSHF